MHELYIVKKYKDAISSGRKKRKYERFTNEN